MAGNCKCSLSFHNRKTRDGVTVRQSGVYLPSGAAQVSVLVFWPAYSGRIVHGALAMCFWVWPRRIALGFMKSADEAMLPIMGKALRRFPGCRVVKDIVSHVCHMSGFFFPFVRKQVGEVKLKIDVKIYY